MSAYKAREGNKWTIANRGASFLPRMGILTAATALPGGWLVARERLYPPVDLSYFDVPISPAGFELHIGYAAITWGGNDRQAIEDISSVGFPGIQIRSNSVQEFGSGAALREVLDKHHIKMIALSSGNLSIDPAIESSEIDKHVANAKFLRDAGGLYLQIIDEKPKDRAIVAADYKRFGALLTELGKRIADLGVQLGYHNHMGSMGRDTRGRGANHGGGRSALRKAGAGCGALLSGRRRPGEGH